MMPRRVSTMVKPIPENVAVFDGVPFVLHVTTDSGKSLEQILAPTSIGSRWKPLARVEERRRKDAA